MAEIPRPSGETQVLERIDLTSLDAMDRGSFAQTLAPVFENAPWVAEAAWACRPFATVTALHAALFAVVQAAPLDQRLAFLRGHPDLAGAAARTRTMTRELIAEQASLGLDSLPDAAFARFAALNTAYRAKFAIPFMICVRRHTRGSILREFVRRLDNDAASEIANALQEVFLISRLRLVARVNGPGLPDTTGRLSTHVLDTVAGRPAPGVRIELLEVEDGSFLPVVEAVTNAAGRTDAPLLSGAPLRIGTYELRFHIGAHFAGADVADPPFLDVVPVRFAIAEPEAHYHVPLVASPWAYSTHRGG